MPRLIFYTTAGCHLCDHAAAMLEEIQGSRQLEVKAVDISSDEKLVARYGLTIPVVHNPESGHEIRWPFVVEDLLGLL